MDKLTERTAHMLISHTKSWCGVCDKVIIPLLKANLSIFSLEDNITSNFNLEMLGIKTITLDLSAEGNEMPKTTDCLEKFLLEFKLLDKMKLLIEMRSKMETEIRKRQEYLIEIGELK